MKSILIVEDDQFIRELYERQIKLAGFSVETASFGKNALEMLEKKPYDLLMLDMSLPDISGLDVLKKLKKTPKENLSIIVLSNNADQELIDKAVAAGAQAYIIKSTYTPEKVVAEVRSFLG